MHTHTRHTHTHTSTHTHILPNTWSDDNIHAHTITNTQTQTIFKQGQQCDGSASGSTSSSLCPSYCSPLALLSLRLSVLLRGQELGLDPQKKTFVCLYTGWRGVGLRGQTLSVCDLIKAWLSDRQYFLLFFLSFLDVFLCLLPLFQVEIREKKNTIKYYLWHICGGLEHNVTIPCLP